MIVTSDAPRTEAPDRGYDTAPYAYAAPAASSFVAILNELRPSGGDGESGPLRDDRGKTAEMEAVKSNEAQKAPGNDDAVAPVEEGLSEDTGADTPLTAPSDSSSDAHTADTATELTSDLTVAPDGEINIEAIPSEPTETASPAATEITTPATTLPAETVVEVAVSPDEIPEETGSAPVAAPPPSPTPTQDADAESIDGNDADAVKNGDGDATAPSTRPTPSFPKNLNALLAESAVRKTDRAVEAPGAAPPATPDGDEIEAPTRAGDLPAPPAPVARAAAMELGGVRTEVATGPRMPLSNLPGELAQQIHMMQQEGTKIMRIRLVPENLGELRIEIHGTGDTLRVRMISGSPSVRDALDSQMGDLKQALQKQGLSLDHVQVDAGSSRDASPQRHGQPGYAPRPDTMARNGAPSSAPSTPTPRARHETASGALNLLA